MIGPSSSPGTEASYDVLWVSSVKLHGARRDELKRTARSSWGELIFMEAASLEFAHKSEVLSPAEKTDAYEDAIRNLDLILAGESHTILKMATINCVLREALPYYFWVGFYLVHDGELVVGPYQGTLGCLHISYDRGVCGAAARTGSVQVVSDVVQFPGHITCDSNSRSEICVPVYDGAGCLIAVFDVDSTELGSFDAIDEACLSRIMRQHFSQ